MINSQVEIFNNLAFKLNKTKKALYEEISEYTGTSVRTVEKWGSGETVLSYDRLGQILTYYGLSGNFILNERENEVVFKILLLHWDTIRQFYIELSAFAIKLEKASAHEDVTMCLLANSLRLLHVANFEHLPYFVLYLYYYDSLNPEEDFIRSYEEFCDELNKFDFRSIFDSIYNSMEKIPCREIWCTEVLDGFLYYIKDIKVRNYFARDFVKTMLASKYRKK